ncbi:MAG: YqgE/AlgH family protein [Pseudomonadota bacterium]|nr:YqgE/AlgH family protein [Pseudomonadota bacterium]
MVHQHEGYLAGRLLIALPGMLDPRFSHSVIYLCSHNEYGAMGLIVNQIMDVVNFSDMLKAMNIRVHHDQRKRPVHFGGPVDTERGFVLHSGDYTCEDTLQIKDGVSLTATTDILKLIASGNGPTNALFALGYAGWGPGQLDAEIQGNGWMFGVPTTEILFGQDNSQKWVLATSRVGIDLSVLSSEGGNA